MKCQEFMVINSFAPGNNAEFFGGNPAAVFGAANNLDSGTMQRIARQMNLVETVFILPAEDCAVGGADFSFRYFTPSEELPIAGHPTVAGVLALLEAGLIDPAHRKGLRLQTRAGIQEIQLTNDVSGPVVMMEQKTPQFLTVAADRNRVADVLGLQASDLMPELPVQGVDTGLGHLIVPLRSLAALFRAQRQIEPLKRLCQEMGVREAQLFSLETLDPQMTLHTRNLCPREGIEDPGCGVGNGALGAYLLKHYYKNQAEITIRAEQGHVIQMPCVIRIMAAAAVDAMRVFIGGGGKVMIKGTFLLD